MAENRVTETHLQVGVQRNAVPGDALVTGTHLQVAMLKDIVPGANARVTETHLQVAILRSAAVSSRNQGFIIV